MDPEKIFFDKVKQNRGWYFVEYLPPIESCRFATVNLIIPDELDKTMIVQAMEAEVRSWIERYRIPVMAGAFDSTGSLIHLSPPAKW